MPSDVICPEPLAKGSRAKEGVATHVTTPIAATSSPTLVSQLRRKEGGGGGGGGGGGLLRPILCNCIKYKHVPLQ